MIKIYYGFIFVVILSFQITSTSPTDYNPAKDGAVSLREAMYLKHGSLQQKQRSESKDIARARFISDEWDYDEQDRPRHKATGIVYTKPSRRPEHPFMDYMTDTRTRRRRTRTRRHWE